MMWKQKMCLGISDRFGVSEKEQIILLKEGGSKA